MKNLFSKNRITIISFQKKKVTAETIRITDRKIQILFTYV